MTESERNLSHIQKAAQLVNVGDYEPAEKLLKEILGTPELPSNIKASALGLLGLIHKFGEKYLEAQDLLESGLALGRSQGSALEGIEGICADALGDVYMTAAHNMVNAGKMEEAHKIVRKLRQIIITYSSQGGFRTVHHEGMTLLTEGMISTAKGSGVWANALDRFGQVVSSPYKAYFVSKNLKFVIGLAYANIGRIHLAQGACEEATQYLEESLRYYDRDSEDAKKILQDVAKARSEKQLPGEIQKLLDDVRFGDRKTKLDAIGQLKDVAKGHLGAVRQIILNAMATGDSVLKFTGAVALATLGDESDPIIEALVANLTPPSSEDENIIKFYALEGLSYGRGRPEIVETLLKVAQHDENIGVRSGAIYALGAIGNPAARGFLEYQSQHGNKSAKIALELFGKADFHEINKVDLDSSSDVRKCKNCGYIGDMRITLLGKKKCPQCGNVGQNVPLLPDQGKK